MAVGGRDRPCESEGTEMKKTKLYMATTNISAIQTANQIVNCLAQAGATEVLTQYQNGKISGLKFGLNIPNRGTQIFVLPARVEPIFKILNGQRRNGRYRVSNGTREHNEKRDLEQAEKVAWRQLLRWCEAQCALIQTNMVEAGEVFMPYWEHEGTTVWEHVLAGGKQLALPPAR